MNKCKPQKTVLIIGGHDPSGGAGIQADIESVTHAGCQAVSVITALTAQNTQKVTDIIPQDPEQFREQIRLLIEDFNINAIKIGMIGASTLVEVINDELSDSSIPVVLDPILHSGTGTQLTDHDVREKMISLLISKTTIITPNSIEARTLTKENELEAAAKKILDYGCNAVLITGTHEKNKNKVINTLFLNNGAHYEYTWRRLPNTYHGSGCTLSSRIAARLALGDDLRSAVEEAQDYTWQALMHGIKFGKGQFHPDRFFDK